MRRDREDERKVKNIRNRCEPPATKEEQPGIEGGRLSRVVAVRWDIERESLGDQKERKNYEGKKVTRSV